MEPKPVIGITMGDPAGVGPEIIVRSLSNRRVRASCRPVVFGQDKLLAGAATRLGSKVRFRSCAAAGLALSHPGIPLVEAGEPAGRIVAGRPSASGGRASVAAIEEATRLALDGAVDAVVTAPISKEAIRMAGCPFPGHTEMLASLTGAKKFAMMLVGGGLRVSLATIHIPLRQVPAALSISGLLDVIELTWRSLPGFGAPGGKIAVCGLNPHAGEAGIMGDEDRIVVAAAVKRAARRGMAVSGPHPADTVFHRALKGEFEAVVAMYHDQGLIPLKTLAFDRGVNLTLGLPVIRTSVDHGTAYDIAGRGVASPESLIAAILLAARLARRGGRRS